MRGRPQALLFTLQGCLLEMWPLAQALSHTRNISLRDWANNKPEAVLVLVHREEFAKALRPFQRWVFAQVVRHVFREGSPAKGVTFFLDDADHAPFAETLWELAWRGAQKARMVLGVQNAQAFADRLGDRDAELMELCQTKVFLQNASPMAALWSAECIGLGFGPVDFMTLPRAEFEPGHGLTITAIVKTPGQRPMKMVATHMDKDGVSLKPDFTILPFVPRPESDFEF